MALYPYQATLSATSAGTPIPVTIDMVGCAGGVYLLTLDTAGVGVRINPPGQTISADNGILLTADTANGPFVFELDAEDAVSRPHLYAASPTDVNVQLRRIARGENT